MRQNITFRRKKFLSGGGISHEIMQWKGGRLVRVIPKKVGGSMSLLPFERFQDELVDKMKDVVLYGGMPAVGERTIKKALEAPQFSQPSGYNRNAVFTAINSALGSGVRPQRMIRKLA